MATVKGGNKFSEALTKLAGTLSSAKSVKIGFFENARYPDGTPVAMVAAIQEFGAPRAGIPPRPYFRNMIAAKKGEWPTAIAKFLKDNNNDAVRTLNDLGELVAGQLRQSIRDTNDPPLAPATIARKGFSKPLVDTGRMLNSISYEVQT